MNRLDPDFRSRARAWADRPPQRAAAEAAARARAAVRTPPTPWPRRMALAALAAGAVVAALLVAPPVPPAPPASAIASPAATRHVMLELRSGTRLYVLLPAHASSRRSS